MEQLTEIFIRTPSMVITALQNETLNSVGRHTPLARTQKTHTWP